MFALIAVSASAVTQLFGTGIAIHRQQIYFFDHDLFVQRVEKCDFLAKISR